MKFDNLITTHLMSSPLHINTILRSLSVILLFASISACKSMSSKSENDEHSKVKYTLAPTEMYLPKLEQHKDGHLLPYIATTDPYSSQKGKINKDYILKFIEAKRAYTSNKHEKAKALLTTLTETQNKLSGPWVLLGDIAKQKNDLKTAEENYKKAVSINEKNINAQLKLAHTQRLSGKFLVAQNTYAATLQQWSDHPEAHLNLAILYDIYLNHPIRAQRHLEAYQFLTFGKNIQSAEWLNEVQSRTGLPYALPVSTENIPKNET